MSKYESSSRYLEKEYKHKSSRSKYTSSDEEADRRSRDKRKHKKKHRSSSADSSQDERDRDKKKKMKRHRKSDDSESHSRSRSRERRKKKKKHRSRSKERERKKRRSLSSESSETGSDKGRGKKERSKMSAREIELLKEEARKRKEILKATETPEEKRARRVAKKEAKERKRKEQMGWDQEYIGYTNNDNPFGDEHLMETFVWSKKIQKEGKGVLASDEIQQMTKAKMEENRRELEKVKKRKLEREREREEREREREQLQRDKEAEYYREWEKSEDTFHLQQAKLRSEIRIKDGRAKPIDLLAKYISAEDDELAIEIHEPYTYLYGLTVTDLEDLIEDIKVYLELEQGKNTEYWRDIVTVTEDELAKLRKLNATKDYRDRREGINEAVSEEVVSVFKGKTTAQLLILEEQMRRKLQGGEGVDVGYWESLLGQLKAHMAKTRLRERHQEVLKRKLFKLKQEQGIESGPLFPSGKLREGTPTSGQATPTQGRSGTPTVDGNGDKGDGQTGIKIEKQEDEQPGTSARGPAQSSSAARDAANDDDEDLITEEDLAAAEEEEEEEEEEEDPCVQDYEAGSYSPKLFAPNDIDDIDAVIYDPADDMKKLELARNQIRSVGKITLDGELEFVKKAREGMNDDEAQFSVEFAIDQQAFMWSDKYRPRKPRFFNRVHTGFEWNKYNQTHYDIDNPPPKIVQGYKFNIFYPDLIDKSMTPEYTVTPLADNQDFAVLRFHAGPPYEDIAFKVVNKEWEHSYKRGFRCQFANNIMQLWFHFKRYRYRR